MLSQFDNPEVYGRLRATLDHDAGLPCRLLGLFAARDVLPLAVEWRVDPRRVEALLRVDAVMGAHDWSVLCARAATLVGVLRLEQDIATLAQDAAA
jgi:hypothetical protein